MQNAEARYERLVTDREPFLKRAREMAKLTIPTLMLPQGHTGSSDIQDPLQALGARGVNSLASKLMLALFPPSTPFFRYQIDVRQLQEIPKDDQQTFEAGLSRYESELMKEFARSQARTALFQVFRHLIVPGNVILHTPVTGYSRYFTLDQFVVNREAEGKVLEIIIHERVSHESLSELHRIQLEIEQEQKESNETTEYDVYTWIKHDGMKHYDVYQEIDGIKLEGTDGRYPEDELPYQALRWTKIDGENYGRGYVEDYAGDLYMAEKLSEAIGEGSLIAAMTKFGVDPGSGTSVKEIAKTPNGGFFTGSQNAIWTLQSQKSTDLGIAKQHYESIKMDLAAAFLMNGSLQRDAERVTATEIRLVAEELETQLGGVYSLFSTELQLPIANLYAKRLEKNKEIKPISEYDAQLVIVTGIDALGRSVEVQKLERVLGSLHGFAGPQAMQYLNTEAIIAEYFTQFGLDSKKFVKGTDQIQQEQQQQQMQQLVQQIAPEAVRQAGNAAAQGESVDE